MDVDMNDAPARISMIRQVGRGAPRPLVQKLCQDSGPDHQAVSSAASAPEAGHSVAVAQRISSTTKTSTMSRVQGMRLRDSLIFHRNEVLGSGGGILCGLRRAQTAM